MEKIPYQLYVGEFKVQNITLSDKFWHKVLGCRYDNHILITRAEYCLGQLMGYINTSVEWCFVCGKEL